MYTLLLLCATKTMDLLETDTKPWIFDGARPEMFRLFSDVVEFARNTIRQVKPRHVGSFTKTVAGNSSIIDNPLIFEETDPPDVRAEGNGGCVICRFFYKTYKYDANMLTISYCKGDKQYIVVQIYNLSRVTGEDMIMCVPKNIPRTKRVSTGDVPFVINDAQDFFDLFKKWLYLDHNNDWDDFKKEFRLLIRQFYDQKHYEINTAPQFLRIMEQARKKPQPIHEVFHNEHLTEQILEAGGYTQRRPPSSSSNFYILPSSALSRYFY